MISIPWRICAWAALAPLAVAVHAAPADPSSAAAEVPAVAYDSAFKTYRPVAEDLASPDKGWRGANEAVSAKPDGGHVMGMPMGGSMRMGDHNTMPMNKDVRKPAPEENNASSVRKGVAKPTTEDMKMPMPKGDASMPGMDMSHGDHRKGH